MTSVNEKCNWARLSLLVFLSVRILGDLRETGNPEKTLTGTVEKAS
jgi:hypothetical protein